MKSTYLIEICCVALTGCATDLQSVKVDTGLPIPTAGAPYNLTFSQYSGKVTRRVTNCFYKGNKKMNYMEISVSATMNKAEVRDPKNSYVLDLSSLQGPFKSTDVKVDYYDSGSIKSINASAEDKVSDFAVSLGKTLSTTAAGLVPGMLSVLEPERCTNDVVEALARLEVNQRKLEELTEQLLIENDQVQQYVTLVKTLGGGSSQIDRKELSRRVRSLIEQQNLQKILKEKVKADLNTVSIVDDVTWPLDGETLVSSSPVVKPLSREQLKRWVENDPVRFLFNTGVYFEIKPAEPTNIASKCTGKCSEPSLPGVKYRMPALGVLTLCAQLETNSKTSGPHCSASKAVSNPELLSQLGPVFTLPLKSRMFSNQSISATFSENGVPTSLGIKTAAPSGKAVATGDSLISAAVAVHNSRAGMEAAELENKIKVLKLRKDYQEAKAALEPTQAEKPLDVEAVLSASEVASREATETLKSVRQTK